MTELRIWLSRICSFLPTFLFGTFSVCIPWKMAHLNMSETDLSFVILTFGIAMIFSIQICRIVLMPKFGTIHLMPLGGLLFSILFYFWTLSLDYLTFISLAIPAGIFWGLISPPANVETFRLESETGRILFPIFEASFSFGMLMGALTSGALQGLGVNPEEIFTLASLFTGAICLLLFILVALKLKQVPTEKTYIKLPSKKVLLPGVIAGIVYATYGIVVDWSAHWLSSEYQITAFLSGIVIYFFSSTELLALLLGSKLLEFFGEKKVVFHAMIVGCLVLLISLIIENLLFIGIAFGIFGFLTANFHPVILQITGRLDVANKEEAIGDVTLLSFVGFIFGPPIIGFVGELYGLTICIFALPIIWIFCAFLILPKLES